MQLHSISQLKNTNSKLSSLVDGIMEEELIESHWRLKRSLPLGESQKKLLERNFLSACQSVFFLQGGKKQRLEEKIMKERDF